MNAIKLLKSTALVDIKIKMLEVIFEGKNEL